ncbi:hypothetical protein [Micromonospora sp. CV4]|uniref:hypothetical protein n=1 Tax=Micromonospora sp. CV4 TaxID=2478711 RepID=UPI001F158EE8|nr:hypothetical protein [Micromonospora sp. CV4]
MLDVEASTRQGYVKKLNKHVRPLLGKLPVGRLDAEKLESFYAVLRRCRDHCGGGRKAIKHRKAGEHECTDKCRPHEKQAPSASVDRADSLDSVGGAERAVRWRWIAVNPADQAEKPGMPQPDPHPPSAPEAARLVEEAWKDPDWGSFVWVAMTTGARRTELCALRWSAVDLNTAVVMLQAPCTSTTQRSCGRRTRRRTSSAALLGRRDG